MWIFQHLVTDICFNQWHRLKKTTTFEIKYSWRKVRTLNWYFFRVLNMICICFLYLTFIFSDGFKNHLTWPWWSMRKQSEQIVLIFYLPFSLTWHCFKYETIRRNDHFDIIFLFQKCNVILSVTKAAKSNPRVQSEMQPNRKCFWYLVKVKISVRTQSGQSQSITLYNLKKLS